MINRSLVGSYIIIIVLLIRILLIKWERKQAYYLWIFTFICLCMPFQLHGPYSLIPRQLLQYSMESRPAYVEENALSAGSMKQEMDAPDSTDSQNLLQEQLVTPQVSQGTEIKPEIEAIPETEVKPETGWMQETESYGESKPSGLNKPDESRKQEVYFNSHMLRLGKIIPWIWLVGFLLFSAWNVVCMVKLFRQTKTARPSERKMELDICHGDHIPGPFVMGIINSLV